MLSKLRVPLLAASLVTLSSTEPTVTDGVSEFKTADTDASGQVNEEEFVTWYNGRKVGSQGLIDFHQSTDPSGNKIPVDFQNSVRQTEATTLSFWTAFVNSIAMIIVTELGDKTFFIAAVLAMRHPQMIIFSGSILALAIMTVLSAAIGFALPAVLPRQYTHYAATILFVYFGIKLLKDGLEMMSKGEGQGPSDELEEVEEELSKKNDVELDDAGEMEGGSKKRQSSNDDVSIFWQALTLTFLAEWGDRSQIATIALASAKDPIGVTAGGILGHSLCTGLAVVGGKAIAGRISERNVLIIGGMLFLGFAVHAIIAGP